MRIARLDSRLAGGTAHLSGEVPFAAVWPALRKGTGTQGAEHPPGNGARLVLTWTG